MYSSNRGFPDGSVIKTPPAKKKKKKESSCNAGDEGDAGLIPGSGRFPGGEHSNPLQYSCLGNPMDSPAGYSPWGHKELALTEATEHACIYLVSGTLKLRHRSSDLVL